MEQHPNVLDPVVLRDDAGHEYASRVENLGTRLVVVAEPYDLPADEEYGNGREISVAWPEPDGSVTVLPTRILAVHAHDSVQVWSLLVTGAAFTEQRRRVERVEVAGPVAVRSSDGHDRHAVPGSLVDASEKAIRFAVETGSADHFLRDGGGVVAEFRLGDAEFAIPGRVEFIRATKNPTRFEELVVVFDEPVPDADALRKEIFAQGARTPPTEDENS